MKRFITLIVFLLTVNIAGAQKIIDSLKSKLYTAQADTTRVLLLAELSYYFSYSRPDTAIILAQQAYDLSEKLHYVKGQALALNRIAGAYIILGDYAKGLRLLTKALNLSQAIHDSEGIFRAYNNVGDMYLNMKEYSKALEYFFKEKRIEGKAGDSDVITLVNIGESYMQLQQYDSALVYFNTIYKILKPGKNDQFYITLERDLGEVQAGMDHTAEALNHFHKSLFFCDLVEDKYDLSTTYLSLAKFYQNRKLYDSATFYAKSALYTAQIASSNQRVLDASKILADLFEGKNDKEAFQYLKLATAAKDSLYSQDKVQQMLLVSFEEKQREQEVEAARRETRNQLKLYFLLSILVIFLLLAIVLYRNNRHKQKANRLLQQQKTEIERTLAELKVTQAQLIQSEKMASLGELTAGIAHEIQNPLNFVNNFSETNMELLSDVEQELDRGNAPEVKALVKDLKDNEQKINQHGRRADAIVKSMLQHSRSSKGEKQPTNINALAEEYLRLAYHGFRAKDKSFNAAIESYFDATIGNVNVVPQDIGRVLLNLFNNAFYAVHEKMKKLPASYKPIVSVSTKKAANHITIQIQDNGMGISKSLQEKIFQPFFTTKPTGQGTGLGLSLSYDIVKAHGGELKVESKEGEGAAFSIQLPVI